MLQNLPRKRLETLSWPRHYYLSMMVGLSFPVLILNSSHTSHARKSFCKVGRPRVGFANYHSLYLKTANSGMAQTKAIARSHVWWPGLVSDTEQPLSQDQGLGKEVAIWEHSKPSSEIDWGNLREHRYAVLTLLKDIDYLGLYFSR